MTSTASSHKKYTSLAFKRVFKSRIVNMILALGASIVAVIIAISATIVQNNFTYAQAKKVIGDTDITFEAIAVAVILTIISGFFSLSVVPKMFKQIYKKQSCDSYFSVPIKREEYFVANYFYGLLVNVLCFVIPLLIYIFSASIASNKYINYVFEYKILIPVAIDLMFAVIAIYSAFVMCAVISGKRIQYLFLSLICLICTSTTLAGIAVKVNSIWGLELNLSTLSSISPVENAISAVLSQENIPAQVVISIIEIVGMFIVGYIAFKNRKAEVAEMSLSGKIVPYILLAVLSSAAFFYSATGNGVIDLVVGLILAVLITMVFSAVFYKKPFTRETAITTACVCGVCTILSVGVMLPIFNGYVKYVPDTDKIESVKVSTLDEQESYIGLAGLFNSDISDFVDGESITLTDKENIEKVVALHNRTVDDDVIKVARKNSNSMLRLMLFLGDDLSNDYQMNVSYKITYKLTNGMTVERSYDAPNTLIAKQYFDVLQTEEALSQLSPFDIKNDKVLASDCTNYSLYAEKYNDDYVESDYYYESDTVELKGFDIDKFNEALMKDYLAMEQNFFMDSFDQFQSSFFDKEGIYNYNETICDLEVYYATDKMTDEELAKYKKMSKSQLITAIDEDWDDKIPAESTSIPICKKETNTINYLNSCGAGIKVQ